MVEVNEKDAMTQHEAWVWIHEAIHAGALEDFKSLCECGCGLEVPEAQGLCNVIDSLRSAGSITNAVSSQMKERIEKWFNAQEYPTGFYPYIDKKGRFKGGIRQEVVRQFVQQTR